MKTTCPKCGTTWTENCQVGDREDFFVTRISELEEMVQQLLPLARKNTTDLSDIALCSMADLILRQEVVGNSNLSTGTMVHDQTSPN